MQYNISPKENETLESFNFRICQMKDEGLIDLSYGEIAKIINSHYVLNYGESKYRKDYQIAKRYHDLVFVDQYENIDEYKRELEELQDELYKKKTRTRDAIREKRMLLRDEARLEELVDNLHKTISNLEPLKIDKRSRPESERHAILLISDWHIGMVVDNYWNKFDIDIAKERVSKLFHDTVKYCNLMGVSNLYVVNLGDQISGSIHVTTRVQEGMDSIEQTMTVAEMIANLLNDFNNEGFNVNYVSMTDNHSRRLPNWRESIENESFVKIVDWYVKSRLSKSDITFIDNIVDDGIATFLVGGKNVFAVHGHRDKPKSVVKDLSLALKVVPDLVLMGHYHHRYNESFNETRLVINGSLIGTDEYAKGARYFSKPSQALLVLDGENFIDFDIVL